MQPDRREVGDGGQRCHSDPSDCRGAAMGLGELAQLVEEAERDGVTRRALRRCRSRAELVLAARRLGYAIHRIDLRCAWLLHQQELAASHSRVA
ncbi:MAG: Nif11-like leader peptide family natural product precursor [Synechococcaceae cyanobacterium]|nr:Nif11-like leader peptide family natural product precursor [Synechococcaceae cyanobacterium]